MKLSKLKKIIRESLNSLNEQQGGVMANLGVYHVWKHCQTGNKAILYWNSMGNTGFPQQLGAGPNGWSMGMTVLGITATSSGNGGSGTQPWATHQNSEAFWIGMGSPNPGDTVSALIGPQNQGAPYYCWEYVGQNNGTYQHGGFGPGNTITNILVNDPLCPTDCGSGNPPPPVNGCTDPTATNYNPLATIDDGSCDFGSGGDSFRCLDGTCISCGGPGCQYPTLDDCKKDCGSRGDDPCAIFYSMPQNQQDGCCEKCQGNISPSDPCYQYCDCCKRDLGGDDPCKTNPNPECFWCSEEGGPGGCQPVGGNLMYAQANGFSLYQNSADCNASEPGCRREDPVDICKTNPKDCWFCKSPGNPCIQFSTISAIFTAGYSGTKYPTSNACNTACGTTGPIDDFPVGLDESFIRMQKLANIK